jgi:phage terminase large subunit
MDLYFPNPPFDYREHQRPFYEHMQAGGRLAFLSWHRRAGKDLAGLHWGAEAAARRRGLYWHMLPTARQARKVIWDGMTNDGHRFIDNAFPPGFIVRRNATEMLLELANGSIFQLVGSDNYDSLVGSNPVGVTFSEFALSKPAAWNYIRPILAMNGGWAVFNTTPRGRNHAFDLWETANKPESGWFTQKVSVYDSNLRYPSAREPGKLLTPDEMMDEERRNGMPDPFIRSEYLCDWNAAMVGSVWGDLLEELAERGGEQLWDYERDGVFTAWDLGQADATAIWFFRVRDAGIEFIDHYEARGQPLSHYADLIDSKGYRYVKHWLPHDAVARTLASRVSVLDQLGARFGRSKVAICPRLALLDGIQAARWLLQQDETRFHRERCKAGLDAIRQYHYEYDDDTKMYGVKPEHDWSSHTADAFRYAAVVSRLSGIFKPRAPKPKIYVPEPVGPVVTLDALWADHEKRRAKRVRI